MAEHRYHPDAARRRVTSDNEPDPEDEGEFCEGCGGTGVDHEGPYPGLCPWCASEAYEYDEADRQITDRKENPDDY